MLNWYFGKIHPIFSIDIEAKIEIDEIEELSETEGDFRCNF